MTDASSITIDAASVANACARLAGTLDAQREILDRIESLGRLQEEAIGAQDAPELLGLLDRRQELIEALTRASCDTKAAAEAWRAVEPGAALDLREELRRRADDVAAAFRRIGECDARCRTRLDAMRDRIAGELASLSRGMQAAGAYAGGAPGASFQDRRG